jgi:hypothetical protein
MSDSARSQCSGADVPDCNCYLLGGAHVRRWRPRGCRLTSTAPPLSNSARALRQNQGLELRFRCSVRFHLRRFSGTVPFLNRDAGEEPQ